MTAEPVASMQPPGLNCVSSRAPASPVARHPSLFVQLNTRWHRTGLLVFGLVVLGHWAEHVAQAVQIWVLHYPKPAAHGLIGAEWPWLVTSEWLHYGFALVMLVGLAVLYKGFTGRAKVFWTIALAIQVWHFFEHQILLWQAVTHDYWFGGKVPTSVLQAVWPMDRPEIHLFYNTLVTIPMVVALYFHTRPPAHENHLLSTCSCKRTMLAPAA
jgi:hypothetical protein